MGERQNRWKKKNRAAMTAYRKKWLKEHPEKRREYENRYREKHRDEVNESRRKWRRQTDFDRIKNRQTRERVLLKYGNKCACCGETTYQFLSFDHKEGRGKQHREGIAETGQKFVRWLDKNPVQKDIQILCHNCNQSLGHYGFCPHHPEITRPVLHGRKRT
jgi:predicted restriction endonuclease